MKTQQHFEVTRQEAGFEQAVFTTLPDVMVAGQYAAQALGLDGLNTWFRNHHNTDVAVSRAAAISPALGEAWARHKEQDRISHSFDYDPYRHPEIEQPPEDSVFLLSGGLDSFASWRLLGQPKAVYFAIGHKAQDRELAMVEKIKADFGADITIDRSIQLGDKEMANGYIPYRNLYFLMAASMYSPNIVLSQIAEYAPDKNRAFYERTSKMLKSITTGRFQELTPKDVEVHTPFSRFTKSQLIHRFAQEYDVGELMEYSVSCYNDTDIACGECNACISRDVAMKNNGIEEPHVVEPNPDILKSKLDIRDYKVRQTAMYLKRWFELRGAI